jgi:hypothetical protein
MLLISFCFLFANTDTINKNIYTPFDEIKTKPKIVAISNKRVLINNRWFKKNSLLFGIYKIVKISPKKITIKNIRTNKIEFLDFLK